MITVKTNDSRRLPVPPPNGIEDSATNRPFSKEPANYPDLPPSLKLQPMTAEQKAAATAKTEGKNVIVMTATPTASCEAAEARAAKKKQKTEARIAKMKAVKSGETTAMPLSGKAALAKIKDAIKPQAGAAAKPKKGTDAMSSKTTTKSKARSKVAGKTKKPAKARGGKAGTISTIAREAIMAGKSNEDALKAVKKAHPEGNTNIGNIRWYRNDLQRKGLLKKEAKARPTKKAAA